jgi:L-2-hydroxyglutarate oxidase
MAARSRDADPIAVVGGGILGLATAMSLQAARPHPPVLVLEKEPAIAGHQTGHNSGVIHSGIYYAPGSLKARLCREGRQRLIELCRAEKVPFELCGKVIVATEPRELPRLAELERRARANGIEGVSALDPKGLESFEPRAVGIRALHVPATGIVDYGRVAQAYARQIVDHGGEIRTRAEVRGIRSSGSSLRLETASGSVDASFLVNCGGLQSDRLARLAGANPPTQIVPFRGEYYRVRSATPPLVRNLLYPVPDPDLPFLGVHFTRRIEGGVEAGPNAVPAFAREGYRWRDVVLRDVWATARFPGFLPMLRRYGRTALAEFYRSLSRGRFLRDLQTLVPDIREEDLRPGGAGVRAQAVRPDGRLVDDFVFADSPRAVHVLNAPSPGATASLAIGDYIRDRVLSRMQ